MEQTRRKLSFSTNWNNKLDCKAFTTLRLYDGFKVGEILDIDFRNEHIKQVEVIGKKPVYINQINDYIAYLDTGYSREECIGILKKMHPDVNYETTPFTFYLLREVKHG